MRHLVRPSEHAVPAPYPERAVCAVMLVDLLLAHDRGSFDRSGLPTFFSFDLLLDDSIASFDTGLHQTDSMTEIQPEMGSTAVPTQLTPMPAGIETALNIEQMVEDPLPPPTRTDPIGPGEFREIQGIPPGTPQQP